MKGRGLTQDLDVDFVTSRVGIDESKESKKKEQKPAEGCCEDRSGMDSLEKNTWTEGRCFRHRLNWRSSSPCVPSLLVHRSCPSGPSNTSDNLVFTVDRIVNGCHTICSVRHKPAMSGGKPFHRGFWLTVFMASLAQVWWGNHISFIITVRTWRPRMDDHRPA